MYDDGFSAFVEEIREGNVLLMVGRAYEARSEVFQDDFYDYILRELNSIAGTKDLDFSDLSYDNRFLLDPQNPNHQRNLHEEIVNLIEKNEYSAEDDVSSGLVSLIKTGLFPFVMTTSFDPLVEIAMREHFGDVRIMNIYDKNNRDISSKADFSTPTIYYLFGKAALPKENEVPKKFVATDNDALEVLKKWQIDMENSALLRYSSEKYLLTLGCTQNDWLFRFIWYTMKGGGENLSKGVVAAFDRSESLSHYLKMNRILINNNAEELVEKILKVTSQEGEARWNNPPQGCDVFISYSRADTEVVAELYKTLTALGLKVWYDKMNLGGRLGGRFLDLIKQAIDTSTLFIAVLSNSISKQALEKHVYRREWEWAQELKLGLTADNRCFVTVSDDYDIYGCKYLDRLGWLADADCNIYSTDAPDFSEWAKVLHNKVMAIKQHGE